MLWQDLPDPTVVYPIYLQQGLLHHLKIEIVFLFKNNKEPLHDVIVFVYHYFFVAMFIIHSEIFAT